MEPVAVLDRISWSKVNLAEAAARADDPEFALESVALLKVTTVAVLLQNLYSVTSVPAQHALERSLFELLFEIAPADQGAILLSAEPTVRWAHDAQNPGAPVPVNENVVQRAMRTGSAVVCPGDPMCTGPHSAVAVPMVASGRMLGVIYLTAESPARRFTDREVQVLTAVGGIAALAIDHVQNRQELQEENERLRTALDIDHDMVGESKRMRQLYQYIGKVARGNSTVLIRGESGTGKELVARAIHRNSPRALRPFVAINCAAVTETLLESEFFGHEKGAFTGAHALKKGKLETANGGTVFLDEIGELALPLQAKLLRVLQEHEFERVGGTRPIQVDIRLIAATNRDLEAAIKDGTFRQDLYYRLNVVTLNTPPLRERREDIAALAWKFAQKYSEVCNRKIRKISREGLAYLQSYDWPGNVRELENAMERAVVLGSSDVIQPEDLPESILETELSPADLSDSGKFHDIVKETKKKLILDALSAASGNFTEAAKQLGLHPNHLHRLATNLQLRKDRSGVRGTE